MKNLWRFCQTLFLLAGFFFLSSCAKKAPPTEPLLSPEERARTITQEVGWEKFDEGVSLFRNNRPAGGAFGEAKAAFEDAIQIAETEIEKTLTTPEIMDTLEVILVDAYSGLGWSNLKLGMKEEAKDNFDESIFRKEEVNALAGRAMVCRDLEGYLREAIDSAKKALRSDSTYEFSHDEDVNYLDLHLLLAQSYFGVNDFDKAQEEVDTLYRLLGLGEGSGLVRGEDDAAWVTALLEKIQELGEYI